MSRASQGSSIEFSTPEGDRLHGHLVRLGQFDAVFDVFGVGGSLRSSEVLPECKILIDGRVVFDGRCTVTKMIDEAESVRCEVLLGERGLHTEALPNTTGEEFERFLSGWLTPYQMSSPFKVAVADFEILMMQLRRWLNQVEISLNAGPKSGTQKAEAEFLARVAPRLLRAMRSHAERFDELVAQLRPSECAVHRDYVFRKWGSYILAAPFGQRTFTKPLGYAGDYEMMNMIQRNAPEGDSLFSKLMHLMLANSWPSESVRNRVTHLREVIVTEAARAARHGRRARVMNLGCGPAWEIQTFIRSTALSNEVDFTVLDFNEETLQHASERLHAAQKEAGRRTGIEARQASVQQLLRRALQQGGEMKEKFDLIYCAGLFDYLSDATCKALVNLFSNSLLPGGLVVVANMNDAKPFRYFIEWLLDWHLIYRNTGQVNRWCPPAPFVTQVIAEPTTVNLFLHVRKPE